MPATSTGMLSRIALGLTITVGLYAVILGCLLTPPIQRFALYAHKINTLFLGDDLSKPEAFGFAKNQVTPFNIRTPDGETLFAWHVLPSDVYARNEKLIRGEERAHGTVHDFTETNAFRLLTGNDPSPARVVVTCKISPARALGTRRLTKGVRRSPRQRRPYRPGLANRYLPQHRHSTQHTCAHD